MKTLLVIALCLVVSYSEVLGSPDSKPKHDMDTILKRYCKNMPLAIVEAIKEKTLKKDGSVDLSSVTTELDKALGMGKAGKERRHIQMLVRRLLQGERRTAKDVALETISNRHLLRCTQIKLIDVAVKDMLDGVCKTAQSELDNGTVDTKAFRQQINNEGNDINDWKSTHDVFGPLGTFVNSFSNPRCGFLYLMKALNIERKTV